MRFPKNKIKLAFLTAVVCFSCKAQQFNFPDEETYYGASMGFKNRFQNVNTNGVSIRSIDPFRLNKVSEIKIYNSNNQLIAFFELDKNGNITGKGSLGKYYFGISRVKCTEKDTVKSEAWYSNHELVRTDSTYIAHPIYKNADTLMEYLAYEHRVYQTGRIINQRNEVYTRKYLGPGRELKMDYDSSRLYLCSYEYYNKEFIASVKNKFINLDTNSLREHRFFRQYREAHIYNLYVEGEGFMEPVEQAVMFCGTKNPDPIQRESSLNSKGLVDKLYGYSSSGQFLICYVRYEYYEQP